MTKLLLRVCCLVAMLGLLFGSAQVVAASGTVGTGSLQAGGWEILGQHTVKVGESLYCIGRAYGVDPWAIATQNDIPYPDLIHPGTELSIPNVPATLPPGPICAAQFGEQPSPPPTPPPTTCGNCACRWTYEVNWGNTLSWISIYYGVDVWSLAQCNCITDLNYIKAGVTLCIP